MGKRGPSPTPTKCLQTAWRREKRGATAELHIENEKPICPTWLSTRAKSEWRYTVNELDKMGILGRIDRGMLAVYCQTMEQYIDAIDHIRCEGAVAGEKKISSWQRIADTCRQSLLTYAREFGLTPSARSRIRVEDQKTSDPLGSFVAAKKSG